MSLEAVSKCEAVITNDNKEEINEEPEMSALEAAASQPPVKRARLNIKRPLLRFVKTAKDGQAPVYGSEMAAGADLHSAEHVTVPAKGKCLVSTGIAVEIPFGYYGRVAPRSGLAVKNFIDVGAGVVDSDYRGTLNVLLFNFSDQDFEVKIGDRIAQLICERIAHCIFEEATTLEDTARGAMGFGSTGIN